MYEHIHLHTPDYRHYVYSLVSTLWATPTSLSDGHGDPDVSLMCGHHPSPLATNQ